MFKEFIFFNFMNIKEAPMNTLALLLRSVQSNPVITQRLLAKELNISLGKTNQCVKEAMKEGYLTQQDSHYLLTPKGNQTLEGFRVSNAIITAAGFGSRFVPLTYETPKGLLEVFGERMIERQIKQLHEAGIFHITIMVGYLKEKFDYLIDQYGVELIYNPEYSSKNTLATLYHCRHLLDNTYLLSSDHWMRENIYHTYEPESWYCSTYMKGKTSEWCLDADKRGRITNIRIGGSDSYVMYGPAYFDRAFSKKFVPLLEEYYHRPGTENFYWEHVLIQHLDQLPLFLYKQPDQMVYEFENLEELRAFDIKYQNHSENEALEHIASIFHIPESKITGLRCLKSGMTNKSFLFTVKEKNYIFRIPGPGTEQLINRKQEKANYDAIKELHLSDTVIHFDGATGYKISKFYENSRNCNPKNEAEVDACMKVLSKFHQSGVTVEHDFDLRKQISFYETLCSQTHAIQFEDYHKVRPHMTELLDRLDTMKIPKVLAHIDSVFANFLILSDNQIRLIDWEYAGMADKLIDPAMFSIYAYYDEAEADRLLRSYLGREPDSQEVFRYYSYMALAGFLWAIWAEYKISLGEEFGDYTLKMYRYAKIYYKKAVKCFQTQTAT